MSHKFFTTIGLLVLSLVTSSTRAADLACGVYQDRDDADAQLIIESAGRAIERSSSIAPRHFDYRLAGNALRMVDMDAGYVAAFKVGNDGDISDEAGFRHYTMVEPMHCAAPQPVAAAGVCRTDLAACAERVYDADEATLGRWCDSEQVPFACDKLIAFYEEQAKQPQRREPAPDMPAVCDETSPAFSEKACIAEVERLMGQTIASGVLEAVGDLTADAPKLSPARLDHAAAMCDRTGSATVCNRAASALWRSDRYLQARDALEVACVQGEDAQACLHVEALVAMDAADERAPPAGRLPCGTFVATTGLMSELEFGDRGLVGAAPGRRMRARLQDGLVRIRHDKGGDFVLRVLDAHRLLGIDGWNEFALYDRQDSPDTCSPPTLYEEVPLKMDCPTIMQDGGARACCDAGKLQGCNALGHQYALQGDWASAKPHYLRMCQAGVRAGCENLLHLFANGGDDSVTEILDAVCAGRATHVACDVRETANWEALGMARALQQMGEDAEAENADP